MNVIVKSSLLTAGLAFTLAAQADAPSSLHLPDTHSDKNMGKISLYRNQIKDYKFGKNDDITADRIPVPDRRGNLTFLRREIECPEAVLVGL